MENHAAKDKGVTPARPDREDVELKTVPEPEKAVALGAVYNNTDFVIIQVTEDKVRLALQELGTRVSLDGLTAPFGIELSLVILLATTDFKSKHLGLQADTWHTIFIAAAILVAIWLLVVLFRLFRGGRKKAIDDCIEKMKGAKAAERPKVS